MAGIAIPEKYSGRRDLTPGTANVELFLDCRKPVLFRLRYFRRRRCWPRPIFLASWERATA